MFNSFNILDFEFFYSVACHASAQIYCRGKIKFNQINLTRYQRNSSTMGWEAAVRFNQM